MQKHSNANIYITMRYPHQLTLVYPFIGNRILFEFPTVVRSLLSLFLILSGKKIVYRRDDIKARRIGKGVEGVNFTNK